MLDDWHPIETAPAVPDRLLFARFERFRDGLMMMKWAVSGFRHRDGRFFHDGDTATAFKDQPTHWARLPGRH